MEQNSGLIVFEKAMNKRFEDMARVHGLKVYKADLQNNFDGSLFTNIVERLKTGKLISTKVLEIKYFVESNQLKRLYFSTSEGYVSHNIIHALKKQIPTIEFIALQHGVFPLKYSRLKECVRYILNKTTRFLLGVYPLGAGFGGIKLNAYYVYSEREKKFLVLYKKWNKNKVEAKLNFIKAGLFQKYQNTVLCQDSETAFFLMQCLNLAGLTSSAEEKRLTEETLNYLAKKYKRLLVKTHPACSEQLSKLKLLENVEIVKDMIDGFTQSKNAYSFFSTALIDAKIFNLRTTGIFADTINVDKEIYENFDLKIDFEEIIANKI